MPLCFLNRDFSLLKDNRNAAKRQPTGRPPETEARETKMSADERILRLENAMATLAELSANQEQRAERLEEGFRLLAQVVAEQQQVVANQQRRTARLEESFVMLTELAGRHEERLDAHDERQDELRAAQAESERKIAELAEAQAHSDRRMDALIDIVQNWRRDGESKT